jgi:hypothetical protein
MGVVPLNFANPSRRPFAWGCFAKFRARRRPASDAVESSGRPQGSPHTPLHGVVPRKFSASRLVHVVDLNANRSAETCCPARLRAHPATFQSAPAHLRTHVKTAPDHDSLTARLWSARTAGSFARRVRPELARRAEEFLDQDVLAAQELARTRVEETMHRAAEMSLVVEARFVRNPMDAPATPASTRRSPPSSNTGRSHPPSRMQSLAREARPPWWTWVVVAASLVQSLQACSAF